MTEAIRELVTDNGSLTTLPGRIEIPFRFHSSSVFLTIPFSRIDSYLRSHSFDHFYVVRCSYKKENKYRWILRVSEGPWLILE